MTWMLPGIFHATTPIDLPDAVFDVAIDLRLGSPNFACWFGTTLSAENAHQSWVPAGFAHRFYVLGDDAKFLYKCADFRCLGGRNRSAMERSGDRCRLADRLANHVGGGRRSALSERR